MGLRSGGIRATHKPCSGSSKFLPFQYARIAMQRLLAFACQIYEPPEVIKDVVWVSHWLVTLYFWLPDQSNCQDHPFDDWWPICTLWHRGLKRCRTMPWSLSEPWEWSHVVEVDSFAEPMLLSLSFYPLKSLSLLWIQLMTTINHLGLAAGNPWYPYQIFRHTAHRTMPLVASQAWGWMA